MNIPFYQVDAFTDQPFKGNPAGVCLPDTPLADHLLRAVASEYPHVEMAWLFASAEGYQLRWFSPKMEMPLCGHATLATAHILWESGREPRDRPLSFHTASGELIATQRDGWIELDFPSRASEPRELPAELERLFAGKYVNAFYSVDRFIIELPSPADVRGFIPDTQLLADHRCVITSRAETGSPYHFISRYFAIPVGFIEDPVTGTAHCSLAPYWASRLGMEELFAYQASPRGGEVRCRLVGDRVFLSGQAVTMMEGRIIL